MDRPQRDVYASVQEEMESLTPETSDQRLAVVLEGEPDSFWGEFDRRQEQPSHHLTNPIEKELSQWKGISSSSRASIPMHTMAGLKWDFPNNNLLNTYMSFFPCET